MNQPVKISPLVGESSRGAAARRRRSTVRVPLPESIAEVALLNIVDVCAAVRMSASWVYEAVRLGAFPQPLRFGPRCTRWRAADVRCWLIDRAATRDRAQEFSRTTTVASARQ
jgi:prophage regulatory protein